MIYNEVAPLLKQLDIQSPTESLELQFLYRHAAHCVSKFGDAEIVELGTLNGASAITIGAAIKYAMSIDKSGTRIGRLTTVDNYAAAERGNRPGTLDFEELSEKVRLSNIGDVITVVKADDNEYISLLKPNSIHMLWVDALHTYEHVTKTLNIALPKLVDGALLCGHDYCWQGEGVVRAVEEFKRDNPDSLCGFGTHWKVWWTLITK